ncbi:hypothetical protein BC829DRAFT_414638 [Chytridium lagenaria]|nr:hypothetical protein BC829DRAFT_414638 [Chytridium lagenaria]
MTNDWDYCLTISLDTADMVVPFIGRFHPVTSNFVPLQPSHPSLTLFIFALKQYGNFVKDATLYEDQSTTVPAPFSKIHKVSSYLDTGSSDSPNRPFLRTDQPPSLIALFDLRNTITETHFPTFHFLFGKMSSLLLRSFLKTFSKRARIFRDSIWVHQRILDDKNCFTDIRWTEQEWLRNTSNLTSISNLGALGRKHMLYAMEVLIPALEEVFETGVRDEYYENFHNEALGSVMLSPSPVDPSQPTIKTLKTGLFGGRLLDLDDLDGFVEPPGTGPPR